jgi:hypothetical protein
VEEFASVETGPEIESIAIERARKAPARVHPVAHFPNPLESIRVRSPQIGKCSEAKAFPPSGTILDCLGRRPGVLNPRNEANIFDFIVLYQRNDSSSLRGWWHLPCFSSVGINLPIPTAVVRKAMSLCG